MFACALNETEPGFLSLVTVVELYWVLHRAHKLGTDRCAQLIGGLVEARELRVGHEVLITVKWRPHKRQNNPRKTKQEV